MWRVIRSVPLFFLLFFFCNCRCVDTFTFHSWFIHYVGNLYLLSLFFSFVLLCASIFDLFKRTSCFVEPPCFSLFSFIDFCSYFYYFFLFLSLLLFCFFCRGIVEVERLLIWVFPFFKIAVNFFLSTILPVPHRF